MCALCVGALRQDSTVNLSGAATADPSQWRVHTIVVSMASCTPPCSGRPSAKNLQTTAVVDGGSEIHVFDEKTLVLTRAPASLKMQVAATSSALPRLPELLLARKLHDGGHENQGNRTEVETTQQQTPRVDPGEKTRRHREDTTTSRTALGVQKSFSYSANVCEMFPPLWSCSTLVASCCHPDR